MARNRVVIVFTALVVVLAVACSGSGDNQPAVADVAAVLELKSAAFEDGEQIPVDFTCDGADRSPGLAWSGGPSGTRGYALIVDDPHARGFVHWVLYDVPADVNSLAGGVPARDVVGGVGVQGRNGFGRVGYGGPCPPRGGPHTYRFTVYALDSALDFGPGESADDLATAMFGHVLATGELVGTYRRR